MAELLASEVEKKMTLPPTTDKISCTQEKGGHRQLNPSLTFFEVRFRSLNQEERTLDIDEKTVIKVLLIDLVQTPGSHDPSVQDKDINSSKCL